MNNLRNRLRNQQSSFAVKIAMGIWASFVVSIGAIGAIVILLWWFIQSVTQLIALSKEEGRL